MSRLGLVPLLGTLASVAIADSSEFVVPAGQRQLFLDDHGVGQLENVRRVMHRPRKLGAVIRPRYIEGRDASIQTRSGPQWDVVRRVYRLWLISRDCYESRDGLHWTPTSKRPNIAVLNAVIDPDDPDPNRRYKGLVARGATREPVVSPDGVTWTKLDVPPIPSQDESNLSYDRSRRLFIATVKHSGPFGRTVWLSTSEDFAAWTKPELIFHPDKRDQELAKSVIANRLANTTLQKMFHNDPDAYNVQVYNMGVFRYEGLYVGLPAMFHSTGRVPNYPNTDGFHVIQLACSRDRRQWKRLGDRAAFIGPSPAAGGAFDLTQILPPSAPIVRGDELWFYYTGLKYRATFRYVGAYPHGKMVPKTGLDRAAGAICLAVLRRDGFVSLDAGDATGSVVSKPFVPPAGQLFLNADLADRSGRLQIAMLAADGRVIARSKPIVGDQPRSVVHWMKPPANPTAEQPIRLRFTLNNGSLYSYWYDQPTVDSTGGARSDDRQE